MRVITKMRPLIEGSEAKPSVLRRTRAGGGEARGRLQRRRLTAAAQSAGQPGLDFPAAAGPKGNPSATHRQRRARPPGPHAQHARAPAAPAPAHLRPHMATAWLLAASCSSCAIVIMLLCWSGPTSLPRILRGEGAQSVPRVRVGCRGAGRVVRSAGCLPLRLLRTGRAPTAAWLRRWASAGHASDD